MPVDAAVEQVAKLQVLSDVHRILRDHEHESTLLRSLSGDLHRTGAGGRTTSRSRERLPLDAAGTGAPRGSQGSLNRRGSNRRSRNFGSAHSLSGPALAGGTATARSRQTLTFADKPHGFKMHVHDPTSHGSRDFGDKQRGRLGAGSGDDDAGGSGGNGADDNNSDTNVRLQANKQHQLKKTTDANGANGGAGAGAGAGGVMWMGKYPYGYMAAPAPATVAPGLHVVDMNQRGGRQVVGGYPILYGYPRPAHQLQSTRQSYRSSRGRGRGHRKRGGRYDGVAGISSRRQDLSDTSLTRGSLPRASALKKQLFALCAVYLILAILSVASEIFALVTAAWSAVVCFAIWGTALAYLGCAITAFGAAIVLHFHLTVLEKLDRLDRQHLTTDTGTASMSASSNPSQRRRYRRWKLAMFVFLSLGVLTSIVLLILASYGLTADTRNAGNTLSSSGNPMLGAHIWKIVVGAAFFVCFGWHIAVTIACSPRYHRHMSDSDRDSAAGVQYSVGGGGAPLSESSMPPPSASVELPPTSGGRSYTPSSGAPLLPQQQQQPVYQPPASQSQAYIPQPAMQSAPVAAYAQQQQYPYVPPTAVPVSVARPYYSSQPAAATATAPAAGYGYYPGYQPIQPPQQLVVNTVPPLVYSTQQQ